MPSAQSLFEQRLQPIAVGEDAVQPFVGRFDSDPSGWELRFTLAETPGAAAAITVEDADIDKAVTLSGGVYVATFSVPYARAATLGLTPRDYAFDLWRVDDGSNVRLAAGLQPVKQAVRRV